MSVGFYEKDPRLSCCPEAYVSGIHSPFACAKDLHGVGMAKALLGQRVYVNDRLLLESARLRSRVRDLETMVEDLQQDNDRLRDSDRLQADLSVELGVSRESVH